MKPIPLPTIADLQQALQALRGTQLAELGSRTGVSLSTLQKLRNGSRADPALSIVWALWPELQAPKKKRVAS